MDVGVLLLEDRLGMLRLVHIFSFGGIVGLVLLELFAVIVGVARRAVVITPITPSVCDFGRDLVERLDHRGRVKVNCEVIIVGGRILLVGDSFP